MDLTRELPLRIDGTDHVRVVVEVPRGSSLKLKYNSELRIFEWSRALSAGVAYPYDYGFLPQTLSGDGDCLDTLVLAEVGSYPGVMIPSRIIGALRLTQIRDGKKKRNDRILCVPVNEHRHATLSDISQLPQRMRDEIEAFFTASLLLTGKVVTLDGWADATEAIELVADAEQAFSSTP
jgi:inorganic pyrophosphatase